MASWWPPPSFSSFPPPSYASMVADGRAPGAVAHGLVAQFAPPPLTDPGTVDPVVVLLATHQGVAAGAQVDDESSAPALDSAPPTFDSAPATFESAPPLRAHVLGASVGVQIAEGAAQTNLDAEQGAQHAAVVGLHALAVAHGLSPATVAAVAAAGPDAVAAALRILGARTDQAVWTPHLLPWPRFLPTLLSYARAPAALPPLRPPPPPPLVILRAWV
jgi:hypothetical protein